MLKKVIYLQKYSRKNVENAFFSTYFFNMDILLNMSSTFINMYMLILETIMEGTVSQFFFI